MDANTSGRTEATGNPKARWRRHVAFLVSSGAFRARAERLRLRGGCLSQRLLQPLHEMHKIRSGQPAAPNPSTRRYSVLVQISCVLEATLRCICRKHCRRTTRGFPLVPEAAAICVNAQVVSDRKFPVHCQIWMGLLLVIAPLLRVSPKQAAKPLIRKLRGKMLL